MQQWTLYIIRAGSGSLYTGITTDVDRRLSDHRNGGVKGSKFLRSKGPLEVVFSATIGNRSLAQQVEARIKKLSKAKKERIVATGADRERLLALLGIPAAALDRYPRPENDAREE